MDILVPVMVLISIVIVYAGVLIFFLKKPHATYKPPKKRKKPKKVYMHPSRFWLYFFRVGTIVYEHGQHWELKKRRVVDYERAGYHERDERYWEEI